MFSFKKPVFHEAVSQLDDGRTLTANGFWKGFEATTAFPFICDLFEKHTTKQHLRILGPFWKQRDQKLVQKKFTEFGAWDYSIYTENKDNPTHLARKNIGYRSPNSETEIRFPYWCNYLTWKGYETTPPYDRFGKRLSIEQLSKSINESFGELTRSEFDQRSKRAVLMTSHLKKHRRRLKNNVGAAIGCDAFGRKINPTPLSKIELLPQYLFNLCPENGLGQGYITEKIPESFIAGCVPITYCDPNDLALDFNPKAVINLCGLAPKEITEQLRQIAQDYDEFNKLRSEPLLIKQPELQPLISFLKS
tara:strand:+ start:166 stop:1083 length:918 start_codon:yes stop_codon:yes gene_type:complete